MQTHEIQTALRRLESRMPDERAQAYIQIFPNRCEAVIWPEGYVKNPIRCTAEFPDGALAEAAAIVDDLPNKEERDRDKASEEVRRLVDRYGPGIIPGVIPMMEAAE